MRPILFSAALFTCLTGMGEEVSASADSETTTAINPGYSSVRDYVYSVTYTVQGLGDVSVGNFQVPITIKKNSPEGFDYSLFKDLPGGRDDLRFFDSSGKSLSYEVQWNEDGETFFWVMMPVCRDGAEIKMCWGQKDGTVALPSRGGVEEVWGDYVGVWHMDEEIDEDGAKAQTRSVDITGHDHDLIPRIGPEGVYYTQTSTEGVFGNSRVNDTSKRYKKQGAYFEMSNTSNLVFNGVFTLSFWIKFDAYANYPQLASRRSSVKDYKGFQIDMHNSNRKQLISRGDNTKGSYQDVVDKNFADMGFVHLAFVYNKTKVSIYSDGICRVDKMDIDTASDVARPLTIGNENDGKDQSVWGKYDEVRLYKGVKSESWIEAEHAIGTNANFFAVSAVSNDYTAVRKNWWSEEPSITKRDFDADDPTDRPTMDDFKLGGAAHGGAAPYIVFYNRATGECLGAEVPQAPGEYRAVIRVDEANGWGALEYEITFRIASHYGSREIGSDYDRILLMNDDDSVEGSEVSYNGYDDIYDVGGKYPHWEHLDAEGNDAYTDGIEDPYYAEFNFGGGVHHVYFAPNGTRLWDLDDIKFGNTFGNAEAKYARYYGDQNYLPWNPASKCFISYSDYQVGDEAEYVGQIAMRNTTDACITSPIYTNGIGTVYFDAVNSFTNNVYGEDGVCNYQLVVEIATNSVPDKDGVVHKLSDAELGFPYTVYLRDADGNVTSTVIRVDKPAYYADWHAVELQVMRFDNGVYTNLGTSSKLSMDIMDGGTTKHFYRVIAPVGIDGEVMFRIRRTAIDPTRTIDPDAWSFILLDNVICSKATERVHLEPGKFNPVFPSIHDDEVYGSARAKLQDGSTPAAGRISAATMHYRWHYIEQKTTEWMVADLNPTTLVSLEPLEVPMIEGDIDYWYDANQCGGFYQYTDYSGTGLELGDSGYSEEVISVTNRAAAWTEEGDWYQRIREGQCDLSEMVLVVKESEDAKASECTEYPMSLIDNNLWSGHLKMPTNRVLTLWWRVEPRDWQSEGETEWSYTTNYWYVTDWTTKSPDYPAAGRLTEGNTNSWSRVLSDSQTGYLTVQVDSSSLGVTVIHSDHQDFNDWSSANQGYFTGSDNDSVNGVSSYVCTYAEDYSTMADTSATDSRWNAVFDGTVGEGDYVPGYTLFESPKYKPTQWDLTKGMWVHEFYRAAQSPVAFQLMGSGQGKMDLKSKTQLGHVGWPRGYESLSFRARVAQVISPAYGSFAADATRLNNYSFMSRICFDMKKNRSFSGNAAMSLFAYYRANKGCYEARWEQIEGTVSENTQYAGKYATPAAQGQRLVISRWDRVGEGEYSETILQALTNSVSFRRNMPLMPYADGETLTNNLMPFCMSVFTNGSDTVIVAGVRIVNTTNVRPGVTSDESVGSAYWCFTAAVDSSDKQLKSGSYGVLSSNCEGMFIRPQFMSEAEYPKGVTPDSIVSDYKKKAHSSVYWTSKELNVEESGFEDCYDDLYDDWWEVNYARQDVFFGDEQKYPHDTNFGLMYVKPTQSVNIYTCGFTGTDLPTQTPDDNWNLLTSIPIEGFGSVGVQPDYRHMIYSTSNTPIRVQAGGALGDYRTDVVIADVMPRQWRGYDYWTTREKDWDWNEDSALRGSNNNFGSTNIVFTSGWITNGAVRLSARRTQPGSACSLRSPLLDGLGSKARGVGLGMIGFEYRLPEQTVDPNTVMLQVQIVTNFSGTTSLKTRSRSVTTGSGNRDSWLVVTNITWQALKDGCKTGTSTGTFACYFRGLQGVKGMMRVAMPDELVQAVATETDPSKFHEVDILSVWCKDNPSLDKGCWWGWNMRTLGDAYDREQRMFLYDWTHTPSECGMSLALNNSVTDGVGPDEDLEGICDHMPFVQSPTFTNAVIGQVRFKARKYDQSDDGPDTMVVVYGATLNPNQCPYDYQWEYVDKFLITNTMYETFTCKTESKNYYALRLGVVGVKDTLYPPDEPTEYVKPSQRVLIDEITISEAVRAVLAFRHVGAFRHDLDKENMIEGLPLSTEQPLCGENWGVQAEVYATMLGNEIDSSFKPRVTLHWYEGTKPWGYENWKNLSGVKSARLSETTGSNYVYRSSYVSSPEAVVVSQDSPGVVQYMLEVEYKRLKTGRGDDAAVSTFATNWLDSAAWQVPDWYAPVDYNSNAKYGAGKTFAAFNILDTVAPGWAWINEVNVFGKSTDMKATENDEKGFQYVEICVPIEADISDWVVRFLSLDGDDVCTNKIAKFGTAELSGTKKDNIGAASNMVFRLLGNKSSDKLKESDGTLDGLWNFSNPDNFVFTKQGGVSYVENVKIPFGVQLVRSSGIIEHSIVTVGTNYYGGKIGYASRNPTNVVNKLNNLVPGSKFFYAAEDCCGTFRSGSVTDSHGEDEDVWENDWVCTPGRINTNTTGRVQQIDPDHPLPQGSTIVIRASVDISGGPIYQRIGNPDAEPTKGTAVIVLNKGSGRGTNIYYQVDEWYELASVTTNDKPAWKYVARQGRRYPYVEVNIGKGVSNNLTVVGKAAIDSDIRKYIDASDPYYPAVMDWLHGARTLNGEQFYNNGEIVLADFAGLNRQVITNMTLKQMYWMDMDPTVSNLMVAGVQKVEPIYYPVVEGYEGDSALTNRKITVYASITNRTEGGAAWAPYALRGVDAGSSSLDYAAGTVTSWSSETFKVTGILANGRTSEKNKKHWVPLRWFVFDRNSFKSDFTSEIEIEDPLSKYSPAADPEIGWYDWAQEHGYTPVFNSWSIDERIPTVAPDVLKTENPVIRK